MIAERKPGQFYYGDRCIWIKTGQEVAVLFDNEPRGRNREVAVQSDGEIFMVKALDLRLRSSAMDNLAELDDFFGDDDAEVDQL